MCENIDRNSTEIPASEDVSNETHDVAKQNQEKGKSQYFVCVNNFYCERR